MRKTKDWPIIGCLAAILIGLTGWTTFSGTDPVEASRAAIRLTARTSLVLFLLAFVASPLHGLAGARATAWILRNRRAFGLGFVLSHLLHAGALVRLWRLDPELFDALTTPASFIAGGTCYAIILALGVTSLLPVRGQMSPRAWMMLHHWGVWVIWTFFLVNFGRRAVMNQMYWPAILLLALALILRLWGRGRGRLAEAVV